MNDKVLSKELIVAAEIYRLTDVAHEEVYYSKLVENLKGKEKVSSSATISKALDVLFDLGMVFAEWKQLENGRWARVLKIAGDSKTFIKSIYENVYCEK
jgi:hypothetical protein